MRFLNHLWMGQQSLLVGHAMCFQEQCLLLKPFSSKAHVPLVV